jgi:hypothetical protein
MAALLLLLPLVAMLFTEEVDWGPGDFILAAIILGGTGLLFELALRRSTDNAYRTGMLLALVTTLLLAWSNAAVGFLGSGANFANVLYVVLIAVPFIGGFATGFKARGMFQTMIAAAVLQAAITLFAFAVGLVGAEESPAIVAISTIFGLLWLASALLFRQAADRDAASAVGVVRRYDPRDGFNIQFVLSTLTLAIGIVMTTFMITVEGEPGALPLGLVLLGLGWFFVTLFRSSNLQEK